METPSHYQAQTTGHMQDRLACITYLTRSCLYQFNIDRNDTTVERDHFKSYTGAANAVVSGAGPQH